MIGKTSTFWVFLCASVVFLGCAKDEGCTNINAANYDQEAIEDDGSCEFEGKMVFWYNQATSQELLSADVE